MDQVLLNALISYFNAERIKVSQRELELQLFSHPDTPSLYAISETLDFLNIENVAAQIQQEQLGELPEHFVAFVDDPERGTYFSHVQQNGSQVYLHSIKTRMSKSEFTKKWNGVVLLAEQEHVGKDTMGWWSAWSGIGLLFLSALLTWPHIPALFFCGIGILGLYLSNEIFETAHDRSSGFGQKICGQNEESGCKQVLQSDQYQLGPFSLNDLFFAFLLATLLQTLLAGKWSAAHLWVYGLATMSVLCTIAIQAFILKTWCRLCLLSAAVVLFQTSIMIVVAYYSEAVVWPALSMLAFKDMLSLGLFFFIALLGINSYRRLKAQNYELATSEIELLRFKRSPNTIARALDHTKSLTLLAGADQIVLGNPKASKTVRLVLSTTCGFCKTAFEKFRSLYAKDTKTYQFHLILNHYNTDSSPRNDVAASLIHCYRTQGVDAFLERMDAWFAHRDAERFFQDTPRQFTDADYQTLKTQRDWCKKNELFHTPILMIDAKIIPEFYDASFLEDILAVFNAKEETL